MDQPGPSRSEGCREPAGCALGCFALLLLYPAYSLMASECYSILSPYLGGGGHAESTRSIEAPLDLLWEAIWLALLCVAPVLLFCALRLMGLARRGNLARGLALSVGIFVLVCLLSYPLMEHSYEHSKNASCQSNLKQLELGRLMYLQDGGEPSNASTEAGPGGVGEGGHEKAAGQ